MPFPKNTEGKCGARSGALAFKQLKLMQLNYIAIEEQLAEALQEIRPAAEYYWSDQGEPGKDCGPYIFFEACSLAMWKCYLQCLDLTVATNYCAAHLHLSKI